VRTGDFKRGMVSILLAFALVFSMILVAPLASPGDLIYDPGGENIEVAQGGTFLIRHTLEWDEPEDGAYSVTMAWDCYDNHENENFTFVGASAYFTTGDYVGDSILAAAALDSAPSPDYPGSTRYLLSVKCPADQKDSRNGQFNVDITLGAYGAGGVPHIPGDHVIPWQFGGIIIIEKYPGFWNRDPITIRVLGRGVAVAISPGYQSGPPGTTLEYTVTITNTGTLDDKYELTISDYKGWGPTLDNYLFENVQPGENRIATLSVTIPENATSFVEDNITVTATSIEYALVSDSASCVAASVQQEGFSEDFDGETWESLQQQGWKMAWDSPYYTSNVSVENGQLYIDMHVGGWGRSTYVWRDASWTDFSASIDFNTIGYWRYSSARVILRASGLPALGGAYPEVNDWVGIAFHMGLEYDSSWILYLFTEDNNGDGDHEAIVLKTDLTQPAYYGSWHLVEATVYGNNVKIWVDGALWADVTDERISLLPAGGIAIASYEADTLVDNIVVNTGTAIFRGLENLHAVRLEKNLDLHQGSKLVVKFYTYSDAFENEGVIETFTPPWHEEENESIMHPGGKPVEKAKLDLTTDDTGNVISTIASYTVRRVDLEARFMDIPFYWSQADPAGKLELETEFMEIPFYWAQAPD